MNRLAPVAVAAVLGLGLVAGSVPGQAELAASSPASRAGLTANAVAAPGSPDAVDDAVARAHVARGLVDVDTAASANAGCDGCSATATALHIAYLDKPIDATADNVTVAWSQCRNCSATSVSVQVVILRTAQMVRANNRALAVNAACAGCRTAAAAYQLVVVREGRDRLTAEGVELLRRWISDQVAALRTVPSTSGSSTVAASGAAPLGELEALVGEGMGGVTTLQRDADVRSGEHGTTPELDTTTAPGAAA